ncbi:hypothetical protein M408DRAFT_328900 [Serendipita vermifera MAFF 305830]|uniref:Histone-lysine N-methyltransferase, H3 lysine-36 specific n=1 Tax=Serendipita vermifera MAFF 305830 TaxID=933852 RepID=A0A0C2WSV0_SERVB|nr:hypothetical protein M408DRAFT_328900 [Serendipita vermifera MAFF 305830]
MEQPGFKTRSPSPPNYAFSSNSWDYPQKSASSVTSDSVSATRNGAHSRNGSHLVKMEVNNGSETPSSESNTDSDGQTVKREPSPSSHPPTTPSKQSVKQSSSSKKSSKLPVQLIPHFPRAEEDALATFETLETNWHQYKYLGKSKVQEDAMACECSYKPGDPLDRACGPHSDCINRLTQVECVDGECRCRSFCQNQRFTKRQYANVHIVKTEMKGFGLRAAGPISRDDFIYEYIGEVVSEPSFLKRMRDYGDEGIEHFYFMMLQKDEFLDATKKGGIGRFANHSCNPNCYVARWVVGTRLRMGIFAKRDIQMHEELTFNYNVDRYGHDAQKCYCGEPNCVGFIGGKTQTDLGGMDDLYIDALGIADEVERLGLKGNRKKKGKKLDEDFTPVLKPMEEEDVPKVVNAIRQTTSRNILTKLIERIKLTEDPAVLRQVTRLRGLTLMTPTLTEYKDDVEVQILILDTISKWPFVNRTKIEDAKIEPLLSELCQSTEQTISTSAQQLLDQWSLLEVIYRIPKKLKRDEDEDEPAQKIFVAQRDEEDDRPSKRVRREEPALAIKPLGVIRGVASGSTPFKKETPTLTPTIPSTPAVTSNQPSKGSLSQIIEQAMEDARRAQAEQEAQAAAAAAEEKKRLEEKSLRKQKAKEKRQKEKGKGSSKSRPPKDRPSAQATNDEGSSISNKEKKLLKLVGGAVVGYLSKWRSQLPPEEFKRHAKEITQKIAEKEKKGRTYQSNAKLDSLTDEKKAKIKEYVKSYVGKLRLNGSSGSKDPRKQRSENPVNGDSVPSPNGISTQLDDTSRHSENGGDDLSQSEDEMSQDSDDESDENTDTVKMDVDPC